MGLYSGKILFDSFKVHNDDKLRLIYDKIGGRLHKNIFFHYALSTLHCLLDLLRTSPLHSIDWYPSGMKVEEFPIYMILMFNE